MRKFVLKTATFLLLVAMLALGVSRLLAADPDTVSREKWRVGAVTLSAVVNVTNGQAIVVTDPIMLINPTEDSTNTLTASTAIGMRADLVNISTQYSFSVAQSGTFASDAVTVSPRYGRISILAIAASLWAGD